MCTDLRGDVHFIGLLAYSIEARQHARCWSQSRRLTWGYCAVLLTELPPRKAAGLRPGAADAKSTDMDAGEPGSDGPMSMSMLCIDTCMHTGPLHVAI